MRLTEPTSEKKFTVWSRQLPPRSPADGHRASQLVRTLVSPLAPAGSVVLTLFCLALFNITECFTATDFLSHIYLDCLLRHSAALTSNVTQHLIRHGHVIIGPCFLLPCERCEDCVKSCSNQLSSAFEQRHGVHVVFASGPLSPCNNYHVLGLTFTLTCLQKSFGLVCGRVGDA